MKKLSLLLVVAIMLSACTSIDSSSLPVKSNTLSQSQEMVEQEKEQGVVKDGANLIATTKTGITELYLQEIISEECFTYLLDFISGGSFYTGISVTDYKIIINEEKLVESRRFDFEYTVTRSDYPRIPIGQQADVVFDGAFVMVESDKEWNIPQKILNEPAVKMMKKWLETYSIEPVLYSKGYHYGDVANYLIKYYGNGELSVDKIKQLAKDKFGIEPHEPRGSELWASVDGMVQEAGMGGGMSYEFISCEKDASTGDSLVRVQYYADASHRVPARLMEYRVSNDERFLDTQIIEHQTYYSVYGGFEQFRGFYVPFTDVDEYIEYEKKQNEYSTIGTLAKAFLTNDAAKMQELIMRTNDVDVTKQFANIRVKPNSYTIYASPENTERILVYLELESGTEHEYSVSRNMFYIGTGLVEYTIGPSDPSYSYNSYAERWVGSYLEHINTDDFMQMPTNDTLNINEFIIQRLMIKNPDTISFTHEQIAQYAKKYLGMDNYIVHDTAYKDEEGNYTIAPRGGNTTIYKIVKNNYSREYPELTVQYYADANRMIKSHLVVYKLQLFDGEYALRDIEVIEKSKYLPKRWSV